jgi:hypothetical protein
MAPAFNKEGAVCPQPFSNLTLHFLNRSAAIIEQVKLSLGLID